jgi:hypothetical protein
MFRNRFVGLCMFMLSLIILGCSDTNTNIDNKQVQNKATSYTYSECEKSCALWLGQTIEGGTVYIWNDEDYLYITYDLKSPWLAEPGEMHIWLGTSTPTEKGSPGKYPFVSNNTGYVSSFTFTIPIADVEAIVGTLTPGTTSIYYMTHVSAVQPDGKGSYKNQNTGYSCDVIKPKKGSWYAYGIYDWNDCYKPPIPPEKDYCLCLNEDAWGGAMDDKLQTVEWGLYIAYSGTDVIKPLWAKDNTELGTVKVTKNSDGKILVIYEITAADWTIGAYHVHVASALSGIPHYTLDGNHTIWYQYLGNFSKQYKWYDLSGITHDDNNTPDILCDDIYKICCPPPGEIVQVYFKDEEPLTAEVATDYVYSSGTVYVAAHAEAHGWCPK